MHSTRRHAFLLGSVVFSQPITITNGVGFNGADVSSVRSPGYGASGYTAARTASGSYFSVADDFKLNKITTLTGAVFYIHQLSDNGNHPTLPSAAFAVIYDKSPALGGNIIWGDLQDNILYDVKPLNMYRVYDNDLLNNNYTMSIVYLSIDVTLLPGTYWIEFLTGAPSYYGPFVPLTYAYQTPDILNFNAMQDQTYYGGTWANIPATDVTENAPGALIFDLYGNIVPETGDSITTRLYLPVLMTVLIGGYFMLLLIRRFMRSGNH